VAGLARNAEPPVELRQRLSERHVHRLAGLRQRAGAPVPDQVLVLVVDVLIVRDDVGRGERRLRDARASEKERTTRDMHVSRPKTPVDAPPVSGVAHGEHSAVHFPFLHAQVPAQP
jgi:hypothetical protein